MEMNNAVCTATGVGHQGPDLVVHCFLGKRKGFELENPRQIPAYRWALPPSEQKVVSERVLRRAGMRATRATLRR